MEIWKEIAGSYGPYEVSSEGRIRRKGRLLRPSVRLNGYVQLGMYESNTLQATTHKLVHRLVAESFFGPIPDGMQINHRNGVRSDNRLENLEIVTAARNNLHAYRVLGRESLKGERHPQAKLTEETVREIRRLFAIGIRKFQLAKKYCIDQTTVRDIINRRRWRHV